MKLHTVTESSGHSDRVFGSSAFTDVIFARRHGSTAAEAVRPSAGDIEIRVWAPSVSPRQSLRIAGSCEALGCWDTAKAPELNDSKFPVWSIVLPASSLPDSFEYKFIVVDRDSGSLLAWEQGWNRRFDYFHPAADEALTVEAAPFSNPLRWYGAGVAIPVFSLRSERSFGIGEFEDLKLFVDWASAAGLSLIQILPVNDTTCNGSWRESYPYNANSIYALHPQYISLSSAGALGDAAERRRFEALGRELNALPTVDYERVNALKHEYLRMLYAEQGGDVLASDDFRAFFEANASWLKPYAVYSVLCGRLRTADFKNWGDYAVCTDEKVDAFVADETFETGYWFFLQYHLDRQLRDVRNYAHSKGVVLKGDIPIGISCTSVDAWMNPEYFHMDSSTGAPPDDFAVKGQNWGFPTYDWERMAEDDYAWWKARFVKMSDYFDAYRIDHLLGFFRIWEIPRKAVNALLGHFSPALPMNEEEIRSFGFDFDRKRHAAPVELTDDVLFVEDPRRKGFYHPRIAAHSTTAFKRLGERDSAAYDRLYEEFFYRRHDDFWRVGAMKKLMPLVSSTRMLVCGEDLGMIPACVPEVMRELQILSLEIERMPKEFGAGYGDTTRYPYLSVSSPSSHDMTNIRVWWEDEMTDELRQRYYNEALGCEGEAPTVCTPDICERMLRRQLESSSMLVVMPLQDWLSVDGGLRRANPAEERVNDPANSNQYWNYRMHLTLEKLLLSTDFNRRIRSLVVSAGR